MIIRKALVIAPLLFAVACSDEPEEAAIEQGGEAAGEVLGGTISDEMIALDQLTSQSPPAEPNPGEGNGGGGGDDAGDDAEGEAASPEPQSEEAEAAPAAPASSETFDEE